MTVLWWLKKKNVKFYVVFWEPNFGDIITNQCASRVSNFEFYSTYSVKNIQQHILYSSYKPPHVVVIFLFYNK